MCFSATASFVLFGTLTPIGSYAIARCQHGNRAWLPFAAFPLAFGIQQGFEGLVWLGMTGGNEALVNSAARGFLFFSHFFWLVWVPFSVWVLETEPFRKRVAALLSIVGLLFGLSIFLPSFLFSDWLAVALENYSVDYNTTLIYDSFTGRTPLHAVYATLVVGALFLASDRRIQIFGGLVAVSLVLTYTFFAYALISVWCFFAAILSTYLLTIILPDTNRPAPAKP